MNTSTPHARVPITIVRNATLSPQARCLFMILTSYAGPNGSCWPSRRTLAADLGLSVRTVATLLGQLERSGLLRRHYRKGASTIFHLLVPSATTGSEVASTSAEESPTDSTNPAVPTHTPSNQQYHGSAADCTPSTPPPATDCTPSGQILSLSVIPGGVSRATNCTGTGNRLHGGVQSASHRTIPMNNTTEPISHREAETCPQSPQHDPHHVDPWSNRTQFDPATRWPSFEQARAYALRSGVPEPAARSIWESYTATGWVDRHGNPIRHWGAAITAAWHFREERRNNNRPSTPGTYSPITHATQRSNEQHHTPQPAATTPATHKWADDPRYLQTVALLEARGYRFNS